MNRTSLAITIALGLAATQAHAGLFVEGSTFTVEANNSPGSNTASNNATITDGLSQSIATTAGPMNLVVNETPDGAGGEWISFSYSGNPLIGDVNADWNVNEVGLTTNQATIFRLGFLSFDNDGLNLPPSSCSIFAGTVSASPVPGSGTGCLGQVISDMNPAGPLPSLGTFVHPFSFLGNTGINPADVTSYFEALDFRPTQVVTTPEPGALSIFGIGLAGLGLLRWRLRDWR